MEGKAGVLVVPVMIGKANKSWDIISPNYATMSRAQVVDIPCESHRIDRQSGRETRKLVVILQEQGQII